MQVNITRALQRITLRTHQKKNIYRLFIDFSHASLLFNVITINSELRKYSSNSLKYPLFSLELFMFFVNLGIKQNLMKVSFKLEFLLFYLSLHLWLGLKIEHFQQIISVSSALHECSSADFDLLIYLWISQMDLFGALHFLKDLKSELLTF